jgi:hypothetical protein
MRQHADQAAALLKAQANPQRLLVLCLLMLLCKVGRMGPR